MNNTHNRLSVGVGVCTYCYVNKIFIKFNPREFYLSMVTICFAIRARYMPDVSMERQRFYLTNLNTTRNRSFALLYISQWKTGALYYLSSLTIVNLEVFIMSCEQLTLTTKKALLALADNNLDELRKYFHEAVTFFVPGGPYQIEGLESYVESNREFTDLEITTTYLDIRQPIVHGDESGTAVLAFYLVTHKKVKNLSLSWLGRGTALYVKGKIQHLHLTRNESTTSHIFPSARIESKTGAQELSTENSSAITLDQILRSGKWGSLHPEPYFNSIDIEQRF